MIKKENDNIIKKNNELKTEGNINNNNNDLNMDSSYYSETLSST